MVELDHGLAHFGDRTSQFVGRQSMAEPYLAKNCGKTTGMGDLLSTTTPHAVPRSPTQVTESKTSKAVCTALTRVVFGVRCGIRRPGVWMVQKSWETDKMILRQLKHVKCNNAKSREIISGRSCTVFRCQLRLYERTTLGIASGQTIDLWYDRSMELQPAMVHVGCEMLLQKKK